MPKKDSKYIREKIKANEARIEEIQTEMKSGNTRHKSTEPDREVIKLWEELGRLSQEIIKLKHGK